jgi:exodeoxyribonuclease VII small subunit
MTTDVPILPDDIAVMSFEQALAELEDIIRRLEAGSVNLEESIEIYSRGTLLKTHCEAKLRNAQSRVEQIVVGPDGGTAAQAVDFD